MGIDTRYWGPSAWQLFHLVAFRTPHPDDVLNDMKDVLPCKYCRASTTEFVHKHPLRGDPGKWLYDIHNMVNHKLREQSKEDKNVRDPGPNPTFAEVKAKYADLKPNAVPGRDFLFALAYNYPDKPEEADMSTQRSFLHHLALSYPFLRMARVFQAYLKKYEPTLSSRKAYLHWMYGLLKQLSEFAKVDIPTFRGYAHHVAYYKSGCNKKTYHGKTCRKLAGGGLTKSRDHRKTYRVAHRSLL
jgi:Erv1 / Alr family